MLVLEVVVDQHATLSLTRAPADTARPDRMTDPSAG